MARGSKNYSEVTHKASKEGTKAKQKAVWDMIGAKKKLHEMVEALIGGDSKAAASALHAYLQQKTRAILGEHDEEMDMDFGDEEGLEQGDERGGEEEHFGDEEPEECEHCHGEGCEECEHDDEGGEDDLEGLEGGDEHGDEEHDMERPPMFGEGARGDATSTDSSVKTRMNKLPADAKDLERKVKGKVAFKTHGKAKLTHPHNNAAPNLDRNVKGDIKFNSSGRAKLTKPFDNAAPGLDRKVKGKIKF